MASRRTLPSLAGLSKKSLAGLLRSDAAGPSLLPPTERLMSFAGYTPPKCVSLPLLASWLEFQLTIAASITLSFLRFSDCPHCSTKGLHRPLSGHGCPDLQGRPHPRRVQKLASHRRPFEADSRRSCAVFDPRQASFSASRTKSSLTLLSSSSCSVGRGRQRRWRRPRPRPLSSR
jgi:hypothetical protein